MVPQTLPLFPPGVYQQLPDLSGYWSWVGIALDGTPFIVRVESSRSFDSAEGIARGYFAELSLARPRIRFSGRLPGDDGIPDADTYPLRPFGSVVVKGSLLGCQILPASTSLTISQNPSRSTE